MFPSVRFTAASNTRFRGIRELVSFAWLQAWQAIYNGTTKCRRVREKGGPKLSVLFLDRSPGPWYRWALEWCQDSDLKNSSGFPGPGCAPLHEMWHEPVREKIRNKQSQLPCPGSTAGNCQRTRTSSLATRDLLNLALQWGKARTPGEHLMEK